jgi:hypothetical protein
MKGLPGVSIAKLIDELERDDLLPAIVFRSSRLQCDTDAERAGKNQRLHLPPTQQRDIQTKIKEIIYQYDLDTDLITSHPQYKSLLTSGVGAHHAGQLLVWRLLLEELMSASMLRVLVATGTVAAGVDFPARTVVVTAHTRRGADGFAALSSSELQQMSGRAGRRGRDTVGFCIAAPSRFCDARVLREIANKPPEPLRSSYFPSPSTVLNLLRYRTVDGLRYTVERSLAAYADRKEAEKLISESGFEEKKLNKELEQTEGDNSRAIKRREKKIRRLRRQAEELTKQQSQLLELSLKGLRNLGYLDKEKLSEKGTWASNLCTNLVIELAEVVERGMLDSVDIELLVAIIASLSGDSYRQYLKAPKGFFDKQLRNDLEEILSEVQVYNMPGVLSDRQVVVDAAFTAVSWYRSQDWQSFRGMLLLSGVAEGDAARLITQTAEQLNQIARLVQSHQDLANRAEEARLTVLRPPLTEVMSLEAHS